MKASDYQKLLHRFFDGDGEVSAGLLRTAWQPRQRTRPGIQAQIDFGAGAAGPGNGATGADDGARARQPH